MDAYHRITLLNLIVNGEAFEPKKNGVGETCLRAIEQEEAKRN